MASEDKESSVLSDDQLRILEENFRTNRHPEGPSLMLIAAEVGVSEEDVEKWYRLRMAKWRKEQGLPPTIGSVLD
ncbi:homeodomain-only protein-like [Poeciliopsis prolifica]|uniref:homeodomain-only protein-like n=1 Tax=Poeciliopsis prolifica TaxID=188132 RepID=UPI002413379E|nr:homeodomain-only protein-like [Poeciliopsis prolifica]XP_054886682.1 homeodomain-only protein-like [Poeciliopsis prolifica]